MLVKIKMEPLLDGRFGRSLWCTTKANYRKNYNIKRARQKSAAVTRVEKNFFFSRASSLLQSGMSLLEKKLRRTLTKIKSRI